ncbi:recombinase RecF, partial [Vibrio cholerae]|nr:recombinase RecF [Vibrio cholerae]
GRQVDFSEKGNELPAFTKEFLSTIQSLPAELVIKKLSEDTILAPSELENTLFVGSDTDIYADKVDELEKQRIELTNEYQRLNKLQAQLQGDENSILTWIDGFTDNVSSWLEAWDEHPDISDVIDLKQGLQVQLEKLSTLTTARSVEIRGKIEKVIERGQVVTA